MKNRGEVLLKVYMYSELLRSEVLFYLKMHDKPFGSRTSLGPTGEGSLQHSNRLPSWPLAVCGLWEGEGRMECKWEKKRERGGEKKNSEEKGDK